MLARKAAIMIALLIFFAVPGQAAEAEWDCSIALTFAYRGAAINGGSITLYCVTGLTEDTSAQSAQSLAAQITLPGDTKQIVQGRVLFDQLTPGLYLVVQGKNAPGFQPISPFLIVLPMEQDSTTVSHVSAAPKMAPYPASPETGQPRWPFVMLWVSGIGLAATHLIFLRTKNRLR